MLVNLKISNIALIDKLEIDISKGLTVLSGETGAGKSIIIDAINFVLGERADKTLIRTGQNFAKVDAVFCFNNKNDKAYEVLNNLGLEYEDTIMLSRTMSFEGKNECRVNGQIVTVGMLKQVSSSLIDIHGQQEHQIVMNNKNHINILDSFAGSDLIQTKTELVDELKNLKSVNDEINSIGGNASDRQNRIDYLQFQINELSKANLVNGEEEQLTQQIKILNSVEKIKNALSESLVNLDGNSYSSLNQLLNAENNISAISLFKEEYVVLRDRLSSLRIELEDCISDIKHEQQSLSFDEDEYNKIDNRLDEIKNLKRKFNRSEKELIEYLQEMKCELNKLNSSEELLEQYNNQKKIILNKLKLCANKLSEKRKQSANKLEKLIKSELIELGMKNAIFKVDFLQFDNIDFESALTSNGIDNIEFMFSANLGEPLKPLVKVISGGEMSRFMLAFKTVLSDIDKIETLIFDEIDTGISGAIAHTVSKKMATIANQKQVICISHLPQITAMADNNYLISKTESENKTKTSIILLNEQEKVYEISRLLGGLKNSESSLKSAKELIEECDKYKYSNFLQV